MKRLDKEINFANYTNVGILSKWYVLCIRTRFFNKERFKKY